MESKAAEQPVLFALSCRPLHAGGVVAANTATTRACDVKLGGVDEGVKQRGSKTQKPNIGAGYHSPIHLKLELDPATPSLDAQKD